MLARLSLMLLPLALACDPTTPTGPSPDPDTELDTDVASIEMPCPEVWDTEFPPLQIDAYDYQGERVLLASPDCCDMFREVRSADTCAYICAPDGGFTGAGDGRCPDFLDSAHFIETVWTAPAE